MSDYVILTDSSCDLPAGLAAEKGIEYVPLTVRMDGKEYRNELDWREIEPHEFYERLRAGAKVQTSAPTVQEFYERITEACEQGKDVLYLGFSSALSGAYQAGHQAMEMAREKYPERKLLDVDTLSASLGQGLLVMLTQQRKEAGATIEQAAEYAENNRLRLCHWFTMPDLDHLRRGGRVSATSAVLGTMLNIRPVMHMNNRGELEYVSKARGSRAVYQRFIERVRQTADHPEEQMMFISHGDDEQEAFRLRDMVQQAFGVKTFVIGPVGPVIGAHSGPGTIAFFFLGNER